jgi:dTDP-glucose pyrophosphorylase
MIDQNLICPVTMPILDGLNLINQNVKGILLVTDENLHLIGTVTDGDIRRAILAGIDLKLPVNVLLECKVGTQYPQPITAPVNTDAGKLLALMQENKIHHIPLLNESGQVADLVMMDDLLLPEPNLPIQAIIMAGGLGTRLRPLTDSLPKPMLPVGDRPLMELIVDRLREAGIHHLRVATHYQSEKIKNHFGDGRSFGVEIQYLTEEQPLGTAGALGLMPVPETPVLVVNGDVLTQVDFRALVNFHHEHQADMTVAVRQYELQVPYGIIESDGAYIQQVREKPLLKFLVNAGIYLLNPSVYRYIHTGQRIDMTDLITLLLADKRPVASFPVVEYWLDIGQHVDYEQAQKDVKKRSAI